METKQLANAVRALAMDAVEKAKSGHPGMPMGMADAATVLFRDFVKFDASAPDWADRDRFVLSAGHGSMLLYALLHLTGYAGVSLDDIKAFRQLNSKTPGHPEYGHTEGVETTTGPLGQGIANAVGMAMAERMLAARFGDDLVDHRTWVIAGDGCLMEGVSQEAITLAGRHKLEKLVVLWDDNSICIDGAVSTADTTDQHKRFESAGWLTLACDGHNADDVKRALAAAVKADRPVMIAVKTTIGFGSPKKAGTKSAHGEALGAEELAATKAALGWTHGPFEIPADIAKAWREIGARGGAARTTWEARVKSSPKAGEFNAALSGEMPKAARDALTAHAAKMAADKPALATRASSGAALEAVFPHWPEMIGGSADLTGSVNTLVKGTTPFLPETPAGRYVHWGVREHGMASAMNGMALHGGVIPYSGTFLVFSDYSRPAIRLAALMGVRAIHVLTHDSIGLGEDGPTHQPVEHLAALRAIPGLCVFRPCDAVETAEAWALALARQGPSALALSRQGTPALRTDAKENRSARGLYELLPAEGGAAKVSLFATGTEVALAVEARAQLQKEGVPTRVVSAPCIELFREQDDDYINATIGEAEVRIVVEAGVSLGWSDVIDNCAFIGMTGFGASAPAKELYKMFGITTDAIVEAAHALL
ncbi:MAG: transketolase [Alphaproteobacteria bacterium]|nr:MAG: transketolase [Caulobacteraceae bacterium]TPW03369.1 MAG: transketolase [Alphaproteobacteria bacterium]